MAAFLLLDVLFRKERSKNPETKSTLDVKIKKKSLMIQNGGPCRVCLKDGNIPIFTENFSDSIATHIRFFADIEVNEDDGLPKHLCHDCHNLLQGALLFRQQALDTDERLRNPGPFPKRNNKPMTDDKPIMNDEPITNDEPISDEELIMNDEPITNDEPMTDDESIMNDAPITNNESITQEELILPDDLLTNNNQISNDDPITYDDTDDERDWKFIELQIQKIEKNKIEIELPKPLKIKSNLQIEKGMKNEPKMQPKPLKDCKMCIIGFPNVEEYKKHLKSEDHNTVRRPCPHCGKVFPKEYLRAHIVRIHNTGNPYVCEVCGKSFAVIGAMKVHAAIHTSQLPFKCAECPYRGRFKYSLKLHMRVHTGEKPFSCKMCGMRFVNSSNHKMHLFRHTKEARYKCDQCEKGFYLQIHLKEHVRVDHAGIKEHECNICGKMFGRRKQMVKHTMKVHHRKPGILGPLPLYKRYDRQLQQTDKDSPTTLSVYPPTGKQLL